jgi:hypothetical protein
MLEQDLESVGEHGVLNIIDASVYAQFTDSRLSTAMGGIMTRLNKFVVEMANEN